MALQWIVGWGLTAVTASVLAAILAVAHAQDGAGSGLVGGLAEHHRLGGDVGLTRARQRNPGHRPGELGDVGLSIAAVHANGVQLEDFPGEVLVQAERPATTD